MGVLSFSLLLLAKLQGFYIFRETWHLFEPKINQDLIRAQSGKRRAPTWQILSVCLGIFCQIQLIRTHELTPQPPPLCLILRRKAIQEFLASPLKIRPSGTR